MPSYFDCVVVGAGIEGSCTALHLARAGKRTLLIDQFEQGHTRGSSHGASRIIRYVYKERHYAVLMPDAYKAWEAIEEETGQQLITKASMVNISTRPPHTALDELEATSRAMGFQFDIMDGKAIRKRWPGLSYHDHSKALVDTRAGIFRADHALQAVQDLFVTSKGEMKWNCALKKLVPGNPVILKTDLGDIVADSVVLCLGPWAPTFLQTLGLSLPLTPLPISFWYWPEKTPGTFTAPDYPSLLDFDTHEDATFFLPGLEYPGLVKLGSEHSATADPNNATFPENEALLERLKQYIRKYVPALDPNPAEFVTCFYTMTPDHNFILDKHPEHSNIIIGAGFSGTGFKLAPIVGHILGCLAVEQEVSYDISAFKIDRFQK